MSNSTYELLQPLFHPRSIALAGIKIADPEHWTRTFLDSLLEFEFEGQIFLVNPRGGEFHGLEVYRSFEDIPHAVDYVISTVPAQAAPGLVEECAAKGVKVVHFCTAGFGEIDEEEGTRLEAELVEISQRTGIRIMGPNCMGIYCPQSRLSFGAVFPKESGSVGFISQSGGNAGTLVREATCRGIRFSSVISYGNACDLNETDFLEYLTADPGTEIIALYVEGVKDAKRFRQALEKAVKEKPVILLKGGVTQGGARAAAGHTGALAGPGVTWESLCKQLGIIQVCSLEELTDTLVTLLFMPIPKGRNAALIGVGGGNSVLIADDFEKRKLKVPLLPAETRNRIREFTPIAGNILRNPIDYGQTMFDTQKVIKTVDIVSHCELIDFLVGFFSLGPAPQYMRSQMCEMVDGMLQASKAGSKPMAVIITSSIVPEEAREIFPVIEELISLQLPVYFSFANAATAISLVLSYNETRLSRLRT